MPNCAQFRQGPLTIFFFLGLALSLVHVHAAAQNNQDETEILLSSTLVDSSAQFIQEVVNGSFSLKENATFAVKAYVEPITVTQKRICAQKELAIPEQQYVCRDFPCTQTLNFDLSGESVSIKEYPSLQLVCNQSAPGPPPEILVKVELIPEGNDQNATCVWGNFSEKNKLGLTPLKTIAMKEAESVETSYAYLVRRELGLKADDRWRYRADGERLILQSRVDLPLKDVQVVQVFLDQKYALELIQFSVDANGNGRRDRYVLHEQTRHTQEIRNGLIVHTVDLRKALRDLDIDPEKAVLMEPILFLDVTPQAYLRERPIHKIVFASANAIDGREFITPQLHRNGPLYSLDFDLSQAVEELSIGAGRIGRLVITARLDRPQVLSWEKVALVGSAEEQILALAKVPGQAFEAWGGNNTVFKPSERIRAFRPLWAQIYRNASQSNLQPHTNALFVAGQDAKAPFGFQIPARNLKQNAQDNSYINMDSFVRSEWRTPDNALKGRLYYYVSGARNNTTIQGLVTVEELGGVKTIPVNLFDTPDWVTPGLSTGARIKGLDLEGPIYTNEGPLRFDVALLDIQTLELSEAFDYRASEWWIKKAELPFVAKGTGVHLYKGTRVILYPGEQGRKKWDITLNIATTAEFMMPLDLVFPGPLPQPCKATLKFNDQEVVIPYGPYALSLSTLGSLPGNFELEIEYLGDNPLIAFELPKLKAMGLRQTPHDDLKRVNLVIDGKETPLCGGRLPEPKGEWLNLGKMSLEQGNHTIKVENSSYFRFRTLILETDTPFPWPEKERDQIEAVPLWQKIARLGVKTLIFAIVACGIYIFRAEIRSFGQVLLDPVRGIFLKAYWCLSDKTWTFVWGLVGLGLYSFGLVAGTPRQGENYGFTSGGLAMVLVLWHLSRLLKNWFVSRFPGLAPHVYRNRGTPFFAWAIVLLAMTGILVAVKLEPVAEQLAVIGYYLLVVGVVLEVWAFRRERQDGAKDAPDAQVPGEVISNE